MMKFLIQNKLKDYKNELAGKFLKGIYLKKKSIKFKKVITLLEFKTKEQVIEYLILDCYIISIMQIFFLTNSLPNLIN